MEYLQIAFRTDLIQEPEIIFGMFNDIENQHHIEEGVRLLTDVRQFELKSLLRPAFANLKRLRRDVVAAETAGDGHLLLQEFEHFPCATTDFADGPWLQMMLLHHPQNVPDFKWRFFNEPARIFLQIFTVDVDISVEHVARELWRRCHHLILTFDCSSTRSPGERCQIP